MLLLVLLSVTAEITKTHLYELHHSTSPPPPPHGLTSVTKTCCDNVISLSVVGINWLFKATDVSKLTFDS